MFNSKSREEKKTSRLAKPQITLLKFAAYLVMFFGVAWFLIIVVRFLFTTLF